MMKKRTIVMLAAVPLLLSSCVVQTINYATGNPVGSKVGTAKTKMKKDFNFGVANAAKNGGISKVGSVDIRIYAMGKMKVTVTGE